MMIMDGFGTQNESFDALDVALLSCCGDTSTQ